MNDKIIQAISFANEAHKMQLRKGTNIPYVVHPIQVMNLVSVCEGTEDMKIAALLHDTLEDTSVSSNEILNLFGQEVLSIILDLTEPKYLEKKLSTWKKRKLHTIQTLQKIKIDSVCVSLCDKFDNLSAIHRDVWFLGDQVWERFNASFEEQSWYYKSLAEAFLQRQKEMNSKFSILVSKFVELQKEVFSKISQTSN